MQNKASRENRLKLTDFLMKMEMSPDVFVEITGTIAQLEDSNLKEIASEKALKLVKQSKTEEEALKKVRELVESMK